MHRESTLLGLCQRTWYPNQQEWRTTCEDGMFIIFMALFLSLAVGLIALCVGWAIAEIHKAKRTGIDVDGIIRDARRRAHERGRDDQHG
jgi:hypothetical protein